MKFFEKIIFFLNIRNQIWKNEMRQSKSIDFFSDRRDDVTYQNFTGYPNIHKSNRGAAAWFPPPPPSSQESLHIRTEAALEVVCDKISHQVCHHGHARLSPAHLALYDNYSTY